MYCGEQKSTTNRVIPLRSRISQVWKTQRGALPPAGRFDMKGARSRTMKLWTLLRPCFRNARPYRLDSWSVPIRVIRAIRNLLLVCLGAGGTFKRQLGGGIYMWDTSKQSLRYCVESQAFFRGLRPLGFIALVPIPTKQHKTDKTGQNRGQNRDTSRLFIPSFFPPALLSADGQWAHATPERHLYLADETVRAERTSRARA